MELFLSKLTIKYSEVKMKKYLMILFMALGSMSFANQGWTPVSKDQREYESIMWQIGEINNLFSGAALSSGARQAAIFQLLKNIGSPVSYKILQELVQSGNLDKSYLNNA